MTSVNTVEIKCACISEYAKDVIELGLGHLWIELSNTINMIIQISGEDNEVVRDLKRRKEIYSGIERKVHDISLCKKPL